MIEVYVYMENNRPVEVVIGRRHAVDRLLKGAPPTTPSERTAISRYLETPLPDLGSGVKLVGLVDRVAPDREIVRVVGPGSSV